MEYTLADLPGGAFPFPSLLDPGHLQGVALARRIPAGNGFQRRLANQRLQVSASTGPEASCQVTDERSELTWEHGMTSSM